ncbi:MAG: shikimate dehydrogenase [Chthoniobacterales bacterium]|nr:shikimate dehydrogenase [Chthoniobacterales bacterium]
MKESYTLSDLQNWEAAAANENQPIRLGVFGDPVHHSLSPQMHNAALTHCGLAMRYARFQIRTEEIQTALRLLPALGFIGVNLTVPHKMSAVGVLDQLSDFARVVGAINTVRIEGERLWGSNTDGPGFARAIRSEFAVDLRDLRVLLLGAGGGAGRAIAMQCAAEGCERLVLVNRMADKAEQLAVELKNSFADARVSGPVPRLTVIPWEERALRFQIANSDLLVNASSVGLHHSDASPIAASLLAPHLLVYDTVYSQQRTPLLVATAEAGARGANGLSMLLHQGALAFETWFDRDAPIEVMRAALAHELGGTRT